MVEVLVLWLTICTFVYGSLGSLNPAYVEQVLRHVWGVIIIVSWCCFVKQSGISSCRLSGCCINLFVYLMQMHVIPAWACSSLVSSRLLGMREYCIR